MREKNTSVVSRRRSRYFAALLFIIGLAIGCVFGFFFLRRWIFAFRPPMEVAIERHIAEIVKDFSLDPEAGKNVGDEFRVMFAKMRETFTATREAIQKNRAETIDKIETLMPDENRKRQWRDTYEKYFPPPPPPGPPGPPGSPRSPGPPPPHP